jgi:lysozyme
MTEITKLDAAGLAFLANEEGNVLHPYKDSVGVPTIGIGMTYYPDTGKKVTMNDRPITKEQSLAYFAQMVKPYELAVYSTTRDDLTQNQFNALVSLAYNIGTAGFKGSTVHRLVNASVCGQPLKDAFLAWCKAGGTVNLALKERRKREFNLYMKA